MPWSSGTFSRSTGVYNGSTAWKQTDDAAEGILSTRHDTHDQDLSDGINNCLTKDGQNAATSDLPMGSNKHTAVGQAAARNQYLRYDQLQDGDIFVLGSVSGTDTITAAAPITITAYTNGMLFQLEPAATNTGAATINIDSIGAADIKKYNSTTDLVAGDMQAGGRYLIAYDSGTSDFNLLNPERSAALASTSNGEGASLIGIEDSASNFAATNVEAALAEIIADYAATTNGNGASKIGIEDSGGLITATTVEAALAELAAALTPPTVQTFSTSGTWTKPANCKKVLVELVGGGGAGGGAAESSGDPAGSGGGAGGYARELIDVTGTSSETVTIGAGGTPAAGTDGGNGGTTSFGAFCSATGGAGGKGGTDIHPNEGGEGGTGSGGDVNGVGGHGRSAFSDWSGSGGASYFSEGGIGIAAEGNGNAGTLGAGGGGGLDNSGGSNSGGAGGAGFVIVTEYY